MTSHRKVRRFWAEALDMVRAIRPEAEFCERVITPGWTRNCLQHAYNTLNYLLFMLS